MNKYDKSLKETIQEIIPRKQEQLKQLVSRYSFQHAHPTCLEN